RGRPSGPPTAGGPACRATDPMGGWRLSGFRPPMGPRSQWVPPSRSGLTLPVIARPRMCPDLSRKLFIYRAGAAVIPAAAAPTAPQGVRAKVVVTPAAVPLEAVPLEAVPLAV